MVEPRSLNGPWPLNLNSYLPSSKLPCRAPSQLRGRMTEARRESTPRGAWSSWIWAPARWRRPPATWRSRSGPAGTRARAGELGRGKSGTLYHNFFDEKFTIIGLSHKCMRWLVLVQYVCFFANTKCLLEVKCGGKRSFRHPFMSAVIWYAW